MKALINGTDHLGFLARVGDFDARIGIPSPCLTVIHFGRHFRWGVPFPRDRSAIRNENGDIHDRDLSQ